ncbi:MAG: hypothetical protein QM770_15465 [Tepidisphaeraceae bacterium]
MPLPADPTWHQQREKQIVDRFTQLLDDKGFVIDTAEGRRSLAGSLRQVSSADREVEAKRKMIELGVFDRSLQSKLPVGASVDVTIAGKSMVVFTKTIGQIRFISAPPTEALIKGQPPVPMSAQQLQQVLTQFPPALPGAPLTVVLFSSGGFAPDAVALASAKSNERTLLLVECNDMGGWNTHGPADLRSTLDLLDPEDAESKAKRVRDELNNSLVDIQTGGLSAEKLATRLGLPLATVEAEFTAVAGERKGLAAKRFDGRLVLYQESSVVASGGSDMPLMDKLRSLFGGGNSNEKKLAFLAERRTAIAQQQEKVQTEVSALETHEAKLKEDFKTNESPLIRKRITTQMLQLRKDIDRKHQLMQMLNQQANVVAAHLHSIEMIQQGQSIKLPDSEDMSEDAAKAEEMLASLQADSELADELSTAGVGTMSDEEQALFDELMKETAPKVAEDKKDSAKAQTTAGEPSKTPTEPQKTPAEPNKRQAAQSG